MNKNKLLHDSLKLCQHVHTQTHTIFLLLTDCLFMIIHFFPFIYLFIFLKNEGNQKMMTRKMFWKKIKKKNWFFIFVFGEKSRMTMMAKIMLLFFLFIVVVGRFSDSDLSNTWTRTLVKRRQTDHEEDDDDDDDCFLRSQWRRSAAAINIVLLLLLLCLILFSFVSFQVHSAATAIIIITWIRLKHKYV